MIVTERDFTKRIEEKAINGMSYIEAAIEVCNEFSVDYDYVGNLISRPIKEKIYNEAQDKNIFKRKSVSLDKFL